ncbi:hypothetical protein ABS755_07900 [Castellaniella sp. FW104-16D08]|uniref:hypothetical protein n=1 Tax=unclassified Castellaniella TaxID=2617606 RepID=UPI003315AF17
MSEMGDDWNEIRKERQAKRATNRDQSAGYLAQRGIHYTSHNGGAHLIVEGPECFIDFWPGTGRWRTRDGHTGFGVRNLVLHYWGPQP